MKIKKKCQTNNEIRFMHFGQQQHLNYQNRKKK